MTLIEALKSGRNYRKVGNDVWLRPDSHGNLFFKKEVLADYEIEPEKYEFECSWDYCMERDLFHPYRKYSGKIPIEILGKKTKVTIEVIED